MGDRNEVLLPAIQHGWLDRPDCRLYYEVSGTGPRAPFCPRPRE